MSLYSEQPLATSPNERGQCLRCKYDAWGDSPLKLLRRSFSELARLLALGREFASVLRDSMKCLEPSVVMVRKRRTQGKVVAIM